MNTLLSMKSKYNIYIDTRVFGAIHWFSFFMAFPAILILGQNISIFFFLFIVSKLYGKINLFKLSNKALFLPLLFLIGAIISVIDTDAVAENIYSKGLAVLPNYIYWSLLVVMMTNIRSLVKVESIAKYTMLGVISTIVYYNIQPFLSGLQFIFNKLTPNSFSFILICFSAPCFIYLLKIKKSKWYAFGFLIIAVFYLISEGRRAGTMLVFLPCMLALLFSKIEVKKLIFGMLVFLASFGVMQTQGAEDLVKSLNPRIYSLLYESENITTEDRSYLVRRLQVEKALLIFREHPMTGIGLNNFTNYSVEFEGNFKGAEFVLRKEGMNEKSSHNSYASLLAEGGLLLLLPFIGLLLFNVVHFVKKYNNRSQIENAYYWSFCAMSTHLYFVTGIVNIYPWFLLSIVTMLSVKYSILRNKNVKS